MKRMITIMLMLLYTAATFGAVKKHGCSMMSSIESSAQCAANISFCESHTTINRNSCCENVNNFSATAQQKVSEESYFSNTDAAHFLPSSLYMGAQFTQKVSSSIHAGAEPLHVNSLYLLYRVFRL